MVRALRLSSLVVAVLLAVAACGSEDQSASDEPAAAKSSRTESTPTAGSSAKAAPTKRPGASIDITISGETVDPDGVQRMVKAGEPINFTIDADRPGELHVHSSPEQEIAYRAGTTQKTITIDQPGVVDVEAHDPAKLVVQLEVR